MTSRRQAGFTLIELVVVILIIGILTAFGVPQYLKSVESTKADDAVAMARMVATTNRMFYLDHSSTYASGQLTTTGTGCNAGDTCPTAGPYGACALVACRYLSGQDWDRKPYMVYALDGASASTTCGQPSGNYVACVMRKNSTNCPGCLGSPTSLSPYSTWGYAIDANGLITEVGTDTPDPVH